MLLLLLLLLLLSMHLTRASVLLSLKGVLEGHLSVLRCTKLRARSVGSVKKLLVCPGRFGLFHFVLVRCEMKSSLMLGAVQY